MDTDARRAARRLLLIALLAGALAAGLPAAYVLREGGSPVVAGLLLVLGLLPAGLAVLVRPVGR